jgi:copper chaperone CopZ
MSRRAGFPDNAPWAKAPLDKPADRRGALAVLGPKRSSERSPTVRDVHVYINRPAGKEGADLEDLREDLANLEHVSDVRFEPAGNVVAVSFEGGQAEQDAIERAVEDAGYEVSRLSVRSDFTEGPNLWDI